MSLNEFIEKIKVENSINYETKDIERYILASARKEANGKGSVGISDDEIKEWILQYTPEDNKIVKKDANDSNKTKSQKTNVVVAAANKKIETLSKESIEESIRRTGMEPLF